MVCSSHGRVLAESAWPAHRSTTGRLPTWTASAAPTSAPVSMMSASACRRDSNAGSQRPWTSGHARLTVDPAARHPSRPAPPRAIPAWRRATASSDPPRQGRPGRQSGWNRGNGKTRARRRQAVWYGTRRERDDSRRGPDDGEPRHRHAGRRIPGLRPSGRRRHQRGGSHARRAAPQHEGQHRERAAARGGRARSRSWCRARSRTRRSPASAARPPTCACSPRCTPRPGCSWCAPIRPIAPSRISRASRWPSGRAARV